jgi:hypothetical protein
MSKKISFASYNCLNSVFNGWFGIVTDDTSDQCLSNIDFKIQINGKQYIGSSVAEILPALKDDGNVLWINIRQEEVQSADDIFCEVIYRDETYTFRSKSHRKSSSSIYKSVFYWINSKIIERLYPRIFIHCWSEEVTIEIIRKVCSSINPPSITLLKPSNLDQRSFDQIRTRAHSDFSLETEVLEVPPRGRDIGGLISALNRCLDPDAPDYNPSRPCLFLHSKNTINIPAHRVMMWRNSLIDPLISRLRGFLTLTRLALLKPAIIYSKDVHREEPGSSLNIHQYKSLLLARSIAKNLFGTVPASFGYCAGTMMWVIPSKVSHIWTTDRLKELAALLEPSETMSEPSHAHSFERLFPEMVRSGGGKCILV